MEILAALLSELHGVRIRLSEDSGIPTLVATAGTAVAVTVDAKLLGACREHAAALAEMRRVDALPGHKFGTPENEEDERLILATVGRFRRALTKVAKLPARTAEGLRAKATILLEVLPVSVKDHQLSLESAEIKLALSLADDVLRVGATGRA